MRPGHDPVSVAMVERYAARLAELLNEMEQLEIHVSPCPGCNELSHYHVLRLGYGARRKVERDDQEGWRMSDMR